VIAHCEANRHDHHPLMLAATPAQVATLQNALKNAGHLEHFVNVVAARAQALAEVLQPHIPPESLVVYPSAEITTPGSSLFAQHAQTEGTPPFPPPRAAPSEHPGHTAQAGAAGPSANSHTTLPVSRRATE